MLYSLPLNAGGGGEMSMETRKLQAKPRAGKKRKKGVDQASEKKGDKQAPSEGAGEKKSPKPDKTDPYQEAVVAYNAAYTEVNDLGLALLRQRERASDLIGHIEHLVNSIANTPKEFARDFEQIRADREAFTDAEDFAKAKLAAARRSAAGAGAGVAAGAAVAALAPSAAMWVATTFGTASTGTAISTLSGAAATNAALAWLGGGTLVAGGGGTAGGAALLALAGPVGWGVAGVSILASVAFFARNKFKQKKEKDEALTSVKRNTATVEVLGATLADLLERTQSLRASLTSSYRLSLANFEADFAALSSDEQTRLGALVNNTLACAATLAERVDADAVATEGDEEAAGAEVEGEHQEDPRA